MDSLQPSSTLMENGTAAPPASSGPRGATVTRSASRSAHACPSQTGGADVAQARPEAQASPSSAGVALCAGPCAAVSGLDGASEWQRLATAAHDLRYGRTERGRSGAA
jgi:hypothetical protein